MRVSILINNYNYGRFVGEAIDSALAQTYADVEVIVVDDGSSDESRTVLAGYEDRCDIVLQENRGQAGAVNTGWFRSTGDVIILLDADDVLLPTVADEAVGAFAANEGLSHVHWPVAVSDSSARPTGEIDPVAPLATGDLLEQLRIDGPLQWSSSPCSGNAFSRRYLSEVMPIPEEHFRLNADAYVVALAPLYGELAALDGALTLYRRHGSHHTDQGFDEILARDIATCDSLVPFVVDHARRRGVTVDPSGWRERNWSVMLARTLADLDGIGARDWPIILIDEQELGFDTAGRHVLPFLERNGEYWGHPEDDDHAISELERMRDEGARVAVLARPSFWWRDAYPAFVAYLDERYSKLLDNERLVAFDLRGVHSNSSQRSS